VPHEACQSSNRDQAPQSISPSSRKGVTMATCEPAMTGVELLEDTNFPGGFE